MILKNVCTQEEKAKVQFAAKGYKDGDKPYIVHDTATSRSSCIRLILSLTALCKLRLFSHDVTQAYFITNTTLLERSIFNQNQMKFQ